MVLRAKRVLSSDDARLKDDPPAGIMATPSENNIMLWNAVIFGPAETPFEDGGQLYCLID